MFSRPSAFSRGHTGGDEKRWYGTLTLNQYPRAGLTRYLILPATGKQLFTCVHTGIAQSCPVHCGGQAQVPGATHQPPFKHSASHTGTRQSLSPTPRPPSSDQSEGQVHTPGAVQLPPFPHVCAQTGTVQLEPNHPSAQEQVSGAAHAPPWWHDCAHNGSRQAGSPVYPGMQLHSSGPTHIL